MINQLTDLELDWDKTQRTFTIPKLIDRKIVDKLNEAIAEINVLKGELTAQIDDFHTFVKEIEENIEAVIDYEKRNNDPIKLGYNNSKPAPAGEKRIDYSNGLDYIREKAIAAYKVGLKQKIAGMKQCKDRMDGQATPIELTNDYNQALDAVLKLLGEE